MPDEGPPVDPHHLEPEPVRRPAGQTALDRAGRVQVGDDLTLPGHPEVFVVGDLMALDLPGVAQVAMQGGNTFQASIFSTVNTAFEVAVMIR